MGFEPIAELVTVLVRVTSEEKICMELHTTFAGQRMNMENTLSV